MRPAALVLTALALSIPAPFCASAQNISSLMNSDRNHSSPEWSDVQAHLPDPATATAARLELAGDVLRARRFGEDALRFYTAAIAHGGDVHVLTKKLGVTCLELQHPELARMFFQRSVKMNKKDPIAWNDLGAADFTLQYTRASVSDYKHAIKLDRNSAVFHSNLALSYFEMNDPQNARHELSTALRLDPDLLHKRDERGYSAQILATNRYAQICFEMARIYASQGKIDVMLDWLQKASERGFDVRDAMDRDSTLRPMLADARVQLILKNTKLLRAGNKGPANIPSLGDSSKP